MKDYLHQFFAEKSQAGKLFLGNLWSLRESFIHQDQSRQVSTSNTFRSIVFSLLNVTGKRGTNHLNKVSLDYLSFRLLHL